MVQVGDLVLAADPETGEMGYRWVTAVFSRHVDALLEVRIGADLIRVTEEHPFWVVVKGWVEAGELQPGDCVQSLTGDCQAVESVQLVSVDAWVYNFTVDQAHTYFVGAGQWLVHNQCSDELDEIKHVYPGKTSAPKWPIDFVRDHLRHIKIKDKKVLTMLRKVEPGRWVKVYENGYSGGRKVSIHYFKSVSGKVFALKVKLGWSRK